MKRLKTCDEIEIFPAGDKLGLNSKPLQGRNLYKLTKQIKQENSYKIYSNCLSTLAKLVNLVSIWFSITFLVV
jgi:hypothetical protein